MRSNSLHPEENLHSYQFLKFYLESEMGRDMKLMGNIMLAAT